MNDNTQLKRLADLGTATVYEAFGQQGLLDLPLTRIIPGSRAAGPALTVILGQNDNLMVHACIEHIRPGDVVVLAMPEPAPVAVVGDLIATQILAHGAAAVLTNAAVRDVEELQEVGLPIWSRFVRVRGAAKSDAGGINVPVIIGGCIIQPGDIVVLDADGAVAVRSGEVDMVLEKAEARAAKEEDLRPRYAAGELSYDLHGLRPGLEASDG
jgi:4-hydroxy-4-methyl-2-oxoglutarate aldolase